MRAWRIPRHGEPLEVLTLEDVPDPTPGPTEVVVEVAACALNFADALLCRGTYQVRPDPPFTPGLEVVGVVREVGADADAVPGTRVLVAPRLPAGGLAERCVARAADLLDLPDDVDDATGVALYTSYQTAWIGLHHRAHLRPGEVLLVQAGAGGTGSAAVQVGVAAGARVIATAGGEEKVARCREMGADAVVDHRREDVVSRVRELTGGRGADVVFDPVGGPTFEVSRRVAAFEGRVLVVGFASGEVPAIPANHVLVKNYDVIGLQWPAYRDERPDLVRRAHKGLLDLLARGRVTPLVTEVLPLEAAADGIDRLARGRTTGKLVVRT